MKSIFTVLAIYFFTSTAWSGTFSNLVKRNLASSPICTAAGSTKTRTGLTLKNVDVETLAGILAVDKETQDLVSNPWIAQYVYIHYFAEKLRDHETKVALQDIVDSTEAAHVDIFTLVNETLAEKLNDPEIIDQVHQLLGKNNKQLRPGSWKIKLANVAAKIRQIRGFRTSMAKLKETTYEGFSIQALDHGLFDFYGATQLGLSESQLRRWDKIEGGFSGIRPGQIKNISPEAWVNFAHFTAETEAPIVGYSTNSGEITRGILPSLSIFLGKTAEEFAEHFTKARLEEAEEFNLPFCTSVWCSEENRHDVAIGGAGEHVSGQKQTADQTYEADDMGDFADAQAALDHLVGRNASEWNANSVYLFLRSHATGAVDKWVDNIRKDETKHMAIFSTAFKYFYGNQPNLRTRGMIKKILTMKNSASDTNSNADFIKTEGLSLFEMLVAHWHVETRVRAFMKTVPLKTMEKLFEAEVKTMQRSETAPMDMDKQKILDAMIISERQKRSVLARWKPAERDKYLALKAVEKEHSETIEGLIVNLYNTFTGAEDPESAFTKGLIKKINQLKTGLDRKTNNLIQMSLLQTLRDYQIMNNRFVRGQPSLTARFVNAMQGFVVDKALTGDTEVLLTQKLTENHNLIRVRKPEGIILEPGSALKVTINTAKGPQTRMLSLTSGPNQPYVEVAVGDSNSNFKRAFANLKEGSAVNVQAMHGGLKFDLDNPAVMIAGGIGITPFRSILQDVSSKGMKHPIHLLNANRTEVPFLEEFDKLEAAHSNLTVTNILTQGDASWQGLRGRINKAMLRDFIEKVPQDSIFYIVGNASMTKAVQAALIELGFPQHRIHVEAFVEVPPQAFDAPDVTSEDGASVSPEKIICHCQGVSADQLHTAISEGASTLGDLAGTTGAGTGCGNCKCTLEKMLSCSAK